MQGWERNRDCVEDLSFAEALERLGIDRREYDLLAPLVEESLWGASDEKLDAAYPIIAGGLRLIFTDHYKTIPPLRIAFKVDNADGGKIVFVNADLR